jgi:hypothetical protein
MSSKPSIDGGRAGTWWPDQPTARATKRSRGLLTGAELAEPKDYRLCAGQRVVPRRGAFAARPPEIGRKNWTSRPQNRRYLARQSMGADAGGAMSDEGLTTRSDVVPMEHHCDHTGLKRRAMPEMVLLRIGGKPDHHSGYCAEHQPLCYRGTLWHGEAFRGRNRRYVDVRNSWPIPLKTSSTS